MQQIGKYQMIVMIIMFELGSTTLFELGIKAKQDSWLAILFGALIGFALLWVFVRIQNRAPSLCFAGLLRLHLGRLLGTVVGVLYAVYFAYESMRNIRDFSELTVMTIMQQTPQWIIIVIVAGLALYALSKGALVFFRIVELLFPVVLISYTLLLLFLIITKLPNIHHLLPILEDGIAPVAKAAFPDIISFPFGQIVVFLMFWHHISEKNNTGKTVAMGYMIVSVFLILMNAITMSVLGPELSAVSALPLLEVVQLIRLANIIERLDVVVTLLLYIGLYVKMTLFFMASVLMISSLFKLKNGRVGLVMIILITLMSFTERNNTEHIWIGLVIAVKVFTVFQIQIPLLLLIVGALRGLGKKNGGSAEGEVAIQK
ncbi:GerAB/ArcD/ProY family transporter [Paenibacillus solisilvae]|uniref:GerAB/ArcD/ProY family transporter n=1 Tax=Paenibacillus solisilvae TaxID=2486751 RepID=A0ABW0W0X1_9BACL